MSFIRKKPLFFILFFGLLLRLCLLFVDYSFDVNNHIIWAKDLHSRGFMGFFDTQSTEVYAWPYPNYPPVALFLFYIVYPLPKILFQVAWWINIHVPPFPSNLVEYIDERFFLAAMLKLPAICADLGLAYMCFLFVRRLIPKANNKALLAVSLILFNPVFFYNSSFWGQIDSVPLFFVLLSFYLLLFMKRPVLSGLIFTLALLVKPTALVFLPGYVVFHIQKYGMKNLITVFISANILFMLSFVPFLSKGALPISAYTIYSEKILAAQSLPYVTNSAFNAWVLIVRFKDSVLDTAPFLFGISYRFWGYAIVGTILLAILKTVRRVKDKTMAIISMSFFVAFSSFLFLTKMHERYYMLPLPFLLLLAMKEKRYLKWFYILSTLSFLNLYRSFAVPFIKPFFDFIDTPVAYITISALGVFIFLYLFKTYLLLVNKKG